MRGKVYDLVEGVSLKEKGLGLDERKLVLGVMAIMVWQDWMGITNHGIPKEVTDSQEREGGITEGKEEGDAVY